MENNSMKKIVIDGKELVIIEKEIPEEDIPSVKFKQNDDYSYEWEVWRDVGFKQFKDGGTRYAFFVNDKKNKKVRLACLTDVDGYNNFDIIEYKGELFILRGQFLYQINGQRIIGTNPVHFDNYKKADLKEYLNSRLSEYQLPKVAINKSSFFDGDFIDEYSISNSALYSVRNTLWHGIKILNQDLCGLFSVDENFDFYDEVIEVLSMDKLPVSDDLICWDKIKLEVDEEAIKSKYQSKVEHKEIVNIIDRMDKEKIINNILSNKEVRLLLLTANNIYNQNKQFDSKLKQNEKQEIDYSFLILNYVKALEVFMANKLISINLLSEKRKNKATFYNLIDLILNNKNSIAKQNNLPLSFIDYYKELLIKFKNNYRNGYFHKDILRNRKSAQKIIDISIVLIIVTEVIIKSDC